MASKNPKYLNQLCKGIKIIYLENPLEWTVHMLNFVYQLNKEEFEFLENNFINNLFGNDGLKKTILNQSDINHLIKKWKNEEKEFFDQRKKYVIY